jgi:hypothetical protein
MRFSREGFCYSELFMRQDMYKVIVERPRRGKSGDIYAVSKRQISTREIKAHRLR